MYYLPTYSYLIRFATFPIIKFLFANYSITKITKAEHDEILKNKPESIKKDRKYFFI